MKNVLIATNILLLGIILFQACSTNTKPPKDLCLSKATISEESSLLDEGSMDAHVAMLLSRRYGSDENKGLMHDPVKWPGVKRTPEDTKSIWFDLDRLKNLIKTIEESVCGADCKAAPRLGVRIYLAKYTSVTGPNADIPDMQHIHANYASRVTAFLVGTYDNTNGNHVDFDPMNVGSNKCKPIPFARLLDSLPNKPFKVNAVRALKAISAVMRDSSAMNQGDLMPPPDGTGMFPTANY